MKLLIGDVEGGFIKPDTLTLNDSVKVEEVDT